MIEAADRKPRALSAAGDGLLWMLAAVVVGWPLAMLLAAVLRQLEHPGSLLRQISAIGIWTSLAHSLWSSALATLLGVGAGFGMALALTRIAPRRSAWWHVAALLPLLIPPFIGAFSWVQAYAKAGTLDWLLHLSWPGLYGPLGVIVLLAVHSSPLAYLAARTALGRVDQAAGRAARIHGSTGWIAFRTVGWPVLRPALLTAAGLIFAFNLGDFGIPFELGTPAHFDTATTAIYAVLSTEDSGGLPAAIVLSLLLSFISLTALVVLQRWQASRTAASYHLAVNRGPERTGKWGALVVQLLLACYLILAVILPFISTLLAGLTKAYGLTPVPGHWDAGFFFTVFASDTGKAAWHSLLLAAGASMAVSALGVWAAEAAKRSRWARLLNKIAWIPYALPGTVVGVAAILGFSRILYGTVWIILLAYVGRFWGLGDSIVQVRGQVPAHPERAARIFGASGGLAYRTAVWPYLAASVGMTALLVFVGAIYELTISSLLFGPSSETMSVVVMSANQAGDVRTTAAVAVWMTLFMTGAVVLWAGLREADARRERHADAGVEIEPVG